MPLQSGNLSLAALASSADSPPHALQPTPLVDGMHLRWTFRRDRGYPWFGYYLFRRQHRPGEPRCAPMHPTDAEPGGGLGDRSWSSGDGVFSGGEELVVGEIAGDLGLSLADREFLRFRLVSGVAHRFELTIGFEQDGELRVRALSPGGTTLLEEQVISGQGGERIPVVFEADAIGAVELSDGPAVWLETCYQRVDDTATDGWEEVPGFTYPLCLPVAHPDYPCPAAPPDFGDALSIAEQRIRYDDPARSLAEFDRLHGTLEELVAGGPGGPPMHERENAVPPEDPGPTAPDVQRQRPLDLTLLASLHPAAAQLLGLYWIDEHVQPGERWDYLVLADHDGSLGGDAAGALAWLGSSPSFTTVDGWIAFGLRAGATPALEAPGGARAFVLPGAQVASSGEGDPVDAAGNVGLRWDRRLDGFGSLRAEAPVFYHVWRADYGAAEPSGERPPGDFEALTRAAPVLVTEPATPGLEPSRPAHWPGQPMYKIDRALAEGWFGYRVSAVDIFGRHSEAGDAARWYQWGPMPDPRPWYYQDPPGERAVHGFAVEVLDKNAPPAPAGVEAHALDPRDPTVLQDAAYLAWRESLPADQRESVVGLRVRWAWRRPQMTQAPDTSEFRVYVHPGSTPPPDARRAPSWLRRRAVVGFDDNLASAGPDERVYELFLPRPGEAWHLGLDLDTTVEDPLRFAHVGVSAVDDKAHTPDDPRRAAGEWGGRAGNEGPVTAPCKVVRVRRQPPPPPTPPPPDSAAVFSSPADYHGRSSYTYRFAPASHLDVLVFRALDESVFRGDWALRPRPDLTAQDDVFPPEPEWTEGRRLGVAVELNRLNTFARDADGAAAAFTHYRGLSNDGLRVLAG
ncbi:MAG: hypothetical protein AAGF23_08890, partial [Acidobacteriota bacterium]